MPTVICPPAPVSKLTSNPPCTHLVSPVHTFFCSSNRALHCCSLYPPPVCLRTPALLPDSYHQAKADLSSSVTFLALASFMVLITTGITHATAQMFCVAFASSNQTTLTHYGIPWLGTQQGFKK